MNRKAHVFSGALLVALVGVSFLLSHGLAVGVGTNSDIDLSVSPASVASGETATFTGKVNFATEEQVIIRLAALVALGPGGSELEVALPLVEVSALDMSAFPGVTGNLRTTVAFANLILPGGTLPSTLPGTLPGTLPDPLPGGIPLLGL